LFGDMLYQESEGSVPGEGFKLGQMVGHGNVLLTDRVALFGEVSLTGRDTGYGIEVERAILRYDFGDAFKLSAGRYHTPISYWNTAYHHGLWLQGSVARPEAVKFGSKFIPVHFVGALAEGKIPGAPVTYSAGIGNGRAQNIARAGDAGDSNGSRAVFASGAWQPGGLLGFRVGGGVYLDEVPIAGGVNADERITNGHIVWDRGSVEFISEYLNIRHVDPLNAEATTSTAVYAHAGVRLGGKYRELMPYVRYERMNIASGDVVFEGVVPDYEAFLGGLRWDFSEYAALKFEYRDQKFGSGARVGTLYIQASFAVPLFAG